MHRHPPAERLTPIVHQGPPGISHVPAVVWATRYRYHVLNAAGVAIAPLRRLVPLFSCKPEEHASGPCNSDQLKEVQTVESAAFHINESIRPTQSRIQSDRISVERRVSNTVCIVTLPRHVKDCSDEEGHDEGRRDYTLSVVHILRMNERRDDGLAATNGIRTKST